MEKKMNMHVWLDELSVFLLVQLRCRSVRFSECVCLCAMNSSKWLSHAFFPDHHHRHVLKSCPPPICPSVFMHFGFSSETQSVCQASLSTALCLFVLLWLIPPMKFVPWLSLTSWRCQTTLALQSWSNITLQGSWIAKVLHVKEEYGRTNQAGFRCDIVAESF